MMTPSKYKRQYYMPPVKCMKWAEKEYVDKAPIWCSVDLRDGNQALVIPMSLEQKVEFFKLLVKIGFKEIEVGFPAASETEYEFLRTLIEQDLIPKDVTIQVLTQAREHIIRKTFEAVKGAPKAIVHVYNSTSVSQREQVFKKSKEEILKIAVDGAALLKKLADETEGNFQFEYSPESFTGTEPEYALEVCNAVLDVWQPTADNKAIINLPVTVEHSMPHVYASQVEYMCDNLKYRENVIVSLHPHNDRGCGVADSEMGLLAGADRIEGTLFGNGERTGNVDIVTLGMNMYSQGVDPKIDFSDMPHICEVYEKCTGMQIYAQSAVAAAQALLEQRQSETRAAQSLVNQRQAELDSVAKRHTRSRSLAQRGAISAQQLDDDRAAAESARAALESAKAQVSVSKAAIEAARTNIIQAQTRVEAAQATERRIAADIDDSELKAPRDGRVQYRVAEPGEVLAAGGRVLNMVDLSDVYMTFFLPTEQAGTLKLGGEARLILDAAPDLRIPATISFVASVAQFTPKTVETSDERLKLMFRVKARIPPELLQQHLEYVKTGLPGVAWVRVNEELPWPDDLVVRLPQ